MSPFVTHTGIAALLDRKNVDTDQIIPKQFLRRVEKTGYGDFLFYDWRYLNDGSPNQNFELNKPIFKGASILITGENFGCGSSREHAPWALLDYGFKAIIAPSYADIFYNNCFKNGMLPICLNDDAMAEIKGEMRSDQQVRIKIDLKEQSIEMPGGLQFSFKIDEFRKQRLIKGLDDIALTLQRLDKIEAFETEQKKVYPWLWKTEKGA